MSRRIAFLGDAIKVTSVTKNPEVLVLLLCVILSSEASDDLQCTGEKHDQNVIFHISNSDGIRGDCETQWLDNGKVVGIIEPDTEPSFLDPIINATSKTAILKTCPSKFECMLICPTANIDKKMACSCVSGDAIKVTSVTKNPEDGSPNKIIWIGVISVLTVLVIIVSLIVYCIKQRSGYALPTTVSAQEFPV